jgi:hypothetical protein
MVDLRVARRGGDQGAARRRSSFRAAATRQPGRVVPATFGICRGLHFPLRLMRCRIFQIQNQQSKGFPDHMRSVWRPPPGV